MNGFNLVTDLKGLNGAINQQLASLGGVKSPEMREIAKILRRSVAKTISVAGGARVATSLKTRKLVGIGGTRSAPGEAPRAQTKQLAKSVKAGIVGDTWRIGALRYTAAMLEEGVSATLGDRKSSTGRGKRKESGKKKRTLRIAPRPYLQKALDAVADQMATEFANVAGARIGKA